MSLSRGPVFARLEGGAFLPTDQDQSRENGKYALLFQVAGGYRFLDTCTGEISINAIPTKRVDNMNLFVELPGFTSFFWANFLLRLESGATTYWARFSVPLSTAANTFRSLPASDVSDSYVVQIAFGGSYRF